MLKLTAEEPVHMRGIRLSAAAAQAVLPAHHSLQCSARAQPINVLDRSW